jgi:CRP-like cAMP-binding protein
VVADGEIEVISVAPDGTEEVQRTLGAGRVLGELGILGGHARTATARAAQDSTLWAIEREAFLELYENEPSVSLAIASSMATYLLDADVVAEDLLFLNLEGRVAKRLVGFLNAEGTGVHPVTGTESMSQEEVGATLQRMAKALAEPEHVYKHMDRLALLAGGSRRAVATVLVDMQRRGILISAEGDLIIIDLPGLEELARPH